MPQRICPKTPLLANAGTLAGNAGLGPLAATKIVFAFSTPVSQTICEGLHVHRELAILQQEWEQHAVDVLGQTRTGRELLANAAQWSFMYADDSTTVVTRPDRTPRSISSVMNWPGPSVWSRNTRSSKSAVACSTAPTRAPHSLVS